MYRPPPKNWGQVVVCSGIVPHYSLATQSRHAGNSLPDSGAAGPSPRALCSQIAKSRQGDRGTQSGWVILIATSLHRSEPVVAGIASTRLACGLLLVPRISVFTTENPMLPRTVTAILSILLLSVTACTDHSSQSQNVSKQVPHSNDPAVQPPPPLPPGVGGGNNSPPNGGSGPGGIPAPPDGAAALPEPGTMLLVGTGLAGMAFYRRRLRRRENLA